MRASLSLRSSAGIERSVEAAEHVDFSRLVGAAGWSRLPEAVRRRFARAPAKGEVVRYRGSMVVVEQSWWGFLLAQACRLIGAPFAPYGGCDLPVTIALRGEADGGVAWEREYRYPGGRTATVRSVKRVDSDGGLLECVGGGFGMKLDVCERRGALHFISRGYFWRLGPLRLPLPHLLSPGVARVTHADLGGRAFRFEMTVEHAWLGLLFRQDGVFRSEGDCP